MGRREHAMRCDAEEALRRWYVSDCCEGLPAGVVLAGLGRVQPAVAADGPQSVTFGCLGIPQFFNVPPGVTEITVHAEGAAGGSQGGSGGPGKGAIVTATLTVVPGH